MHGTQPVVSSSPAGVCGRGVAQAKPPSSPGRMTLEYCLAHWTTECRSTLGAPTDPKLVLGGFPTDKASFR